MACAQTSTRHKIVETVTKTFVFTDQGNWHEVKSTFADKVKLDYSSFTGKPAATLSADKIVASWSGFLPGFDSTHHQLGNFIIDQSGTDIKLSCYGIATHYIKGIKEGPLWAVVGTYDFVLTKSGSGYHISQMKFNYKYTTGNSGLAAIAAKRAKTKK